MEYEKRQRKIKASNVGSVKIWVEIQLKAFLEINQEQNEEDKNI